MPNPAYMPSSSGTGDAGGGTSDVVSTSDTHAAVTSIASGGGTGSTGAGQATSAPLQLHFSDDAWDGEFEAADAMSGLVWDDGLRLEEDQAQGYLVSRVFDAGSTIDWVELRWQPQGAYGVALGTPDAWTGDGYSEGHIDAADLSLLLEFDDPSFDGGDALRDDSGIHDVQWVGNPASTTTGVFGDAVLNGHGGHATVLAPETPGTAPFTWALWVRSSGCGSTFAALITDDGAPVAWLNCRTMLSCSNTGDAAPRAHAELQSMNMCSPASITDGGWHHIVLRRDDYPGGQLSEIFVDAELGTPFVGSLTNLASNDTLALAAHDGSSDPVAYDQAAFWNRALEDRELHALYRRGVQRVYFQVRACEDPDCSSTPFVGGFLDPGPHAAHTVSLAPLGLRGRYFQYRMRYDNEPGLVPAPAIDAVHITGET